MKRFLSVNGRKLALVGVLVPLLVLFIYVALRSGPLAPIPVTVTTVENRALTPALFGIGTVESRYTHKIGSTAAGRIQRVDVQVGDLVSVGQVLGEMDPVDLEQRIAAQTSALMRAEATALAAEAQVREAAARRTYAEQQAARYEKLLQARAVSEEGASAKHQEYQIAEAGLAAARANLDAAKQELTRIRAERAGLHQQRANLRLIAPVDGLVVARAADPGTTVVAGQQVIEIIDPSSLWINVRFDQLRTSGLRAGLPVQIVLRSRAGQKLPGRVLRVEPLADVVTEENLAKVVFDTLPEPLPPLGELAEVTVTLPDLPPVPVLPSASVQRLGSQLGVWLIRDGSPHFAPVRLGTTDLDGRVQILDGVQAGEQVVLYRHRAIDAGSRIKIVERVPGVSP